MGEHTPISNKGLISKVYKELIKLNFKKKLKNGSDFWSSDPTSGNISEGTQNTDLKKPKSLYFAKLVDVGSSSL